MASKHKQTKHQGVGRASDVRFERSNSVRRNFLKHKRGLFGSRLYPCVYCGKLISPASMEVDHCIPVQAAKDSKFVRSYIRLLGIFQGKKMRRQGINGTWNLVSACGRCNGAKHDKGGLWVVRGIVGRYLFPILWTSGALLLAGTFIQFLVTGGGIWTYIFKGLGLFGDMLSKFSRMFT